MALSVPLFIAFRYWRSKNRDRFARIVTWLATSGIVLGVMALIIVLSIMNGLEQTQKENVLSTIPHAIVEPATGYLAKDEKLTNLPSYVKKSVPINTTEVIMQSAAGLNAGQLIGINSLSDDPLLSGVTGSFSQLLPASSYNIILSYQVASQLQVNVGDKVRVLLAKNSRFTPMGRIPMQRLFNVSGIYYSKLGNGETSFANISDVGRLLRIRPNEVQGERLFLTDPFDITELDRSFPHSKWKIRDWRAQKGVFFQAVKMEKNMMGLLISLIILIALCNIVTSLSLMVVDKQREIAILQTQGLTKGGIMSIFIFQGTLVGVSGIFLGGILGIVTTLNINAILSLFGMDNIYLPILFDYTQVITILVVAFSMSLLSTLYPAYRGSRVEPAEALRYE